MSKRFLFLIFIVVAALSSGSAAHRTQAEGVEWWLAGSTLKIPPNSTPSSETLHLTSARVEYAPFQMVFRTGEQAYSQIEFTVAFEEQYFDLTFYQEQYLDLPITAEPEIFTEAWLTDPVLPDGLRPLDPWIVDLPANSTIVLWMDLYVQPNTPPGDYSLIINASSIGWRQFDITVYPVDLPESGGVAVTIPIGEANWTTVYFGGGDQINFLRQINTLLLDNDLLPGNFAAKPIMTDEGWDFSPLDAELDALPEGAPFFAPGPYDADAEQYWLRDPEGQIYMTGDFDDPAFVAQVEAYFVALAAYLDSRGQLDDALVYPWDETRWVGDEPIHGGPALVQRLADWASAARAAGFKVHASGVTPVTYGPDWPLPTEELTDVTHVHLDIFDADPQLFAQWSEQPERRAAVYLNDYGDMIELPAAVQRGLIWHVYARGVRDITGYALLEWVNSTYDLVDPWTEADKLYPQTGYGVGAPVWPGPLPSIRIKVLREGVEDSRLLDLYAQQFGLDAAEAFAACLTPGMLTDQRPAADLWDQAHTALLIALVEDQPVTEDLCQSPATYPTQTTILDMEALGGNLGGWDLNGVEGEIIENGGNRQLSITFIDPEPEAGYWFGGQDWSGWTALQIEVQNTSPYFAMLDVGLIDGYDQFILLRNGAIWLGPNSSQTLTLPLVDPIDVAEPFNWSMVEYLSLGVNVYTEQTDNFDNTVIYPLGSRTLIFDNFRLVR